jgi:hypothetical protein
MLLLLVALCCLAKLEEKEKRHPSLPLVETRSDYAVVLEQLPNPKRPSSMARYRRERREPKTVSAVLRRAKKRSGERPRERRHDPTRFWAGLLSNCGRKKSVDMGLLEGERRETGMVAGRKRLFLANCPHRTSNRFGPKKRKVSSR